MYIHRYFNAMMLFLFLSPFFLSEKCFPVLRNSSCFWPFILLLTSHLIKMLTWLMFVGFFSCCCCHLSLSSLCIHLSYCYFRKNINFVNFNSDWIIALLFKIKLLGLEYKYGGGVEDQDICHSVLSFLLFLLYFSICVYGKV